MYSLLFIGRNGELGTHKPYILRHLIEGVKDKRGQDERNIYGSLFMTIVYDLFKNTKSTAQ